MAIRAVVLDIGGVLEIVDDDVFPAPAERRLGLAPGTIASGLAGLPGDAVVGEVTEHQVRAEWQRVLGLDDRQVDALVDDFWRWYVGTLDRQLFGWFAGQRPARLTAILSNSGPGARERALPLRTDLLLGHLADHRVARQPGETAGDRARREAEAALGGCGEDVVVDDLQHSPDVEDHRTDRHAPTLGTRETRSAHPATGSCSSAWPVWTRHRAA